MRDSTRVPPALTSGGGTSPPRHRQSAPLHLTALLPVALVGLPPLAATAVGLATSRRRRLPAHTARRGHTRAYADITVLLIALLARLWQLSTREVCARLRQWPALVAACGMLFLCLVRQALRAGPVSGRDVVLDSIFLAAWPRRGVAAGWSRPVDKGGRFGYKLHLLLDRRARLPCTSSYTLAQVRQW